MRSNILIMGGLLLFLAIVAATLRPVRLQAGETSVTKYGIVSEMYKTVFNDVAVKLHGHANIYYINDALEDGSSLDEWKVKLLNKPVQIRYSEKWTPIQQEGEQHFIQSLAYQGELIYLDKK